ncbi:MAG: phosphate ABC transporter substrate-binding protein, partial [Actinomycetota bacterium]|nr:phosphate ABC transporter substrate-binding protein [Actinomycetota bacterium]
MNRRFLRNAAIPAAVLSLALAACGGQSEGSSSGSGGDTALSGEIVVDGSSTVQPLTAAAGELFKQENPDVNVSVGTAGTGG